MDGSTDSGNIEDDSELMYCAMEIPGTTADANGLLGCLCRAKTC